MPKVRLIDANAAANKIMREAENHADDLNMIGIALMIGIAKMLRDENDFPTIEAEPVRHGRWILKILPIGGGDKIRSYLCSECDRYTNMKFDFCPNCGARMDAEDINVLAKDGGADNG